MNKQHRCIKFTSETEKNNTFSFLDINITRQNIFDFLLYKQIDGVAMGSPLGPTLANAFLCHYEKEWLDNCPSHFKPIVYRRYVDDIFVLFSSKEHLQPFVDYMNKQDRCIKFTSETEKNNTFSFLYADMFYFFRSKQMKEDCLMFILISH